MKRPLCQRADLIRALASGDVEASDFIAAELGFVRREHKKKLEIPVYETVAEPVDLPDIPTQEFHEYPSISFWHVIASEQRDKGATGKIHSPTAALGSWQRGSKAEFLPLTRWADLLPILRRYLVDHAQGSKIDLAKMVEKLSRAEELEYLPRKPRRGWGRELQFIGDSRREMAPYVTDQVYLRKQLRRYFPEESFSRAEYLDTGQLIMTGYWDERRNYRLPSPGSLVIACSDLGIEGPEHVRQFWLELGERLLDQRCRPIALLPTSTIMEDHELKRVWTMIAWDRKFESVTAEKRGQQLERLKVLVSPANRIDPGFLRDVRRLMGADASIEARFLQCAELKSRCCVAAAFESEDSIRLRKQFQLEDEVTRRAVLASLRHWRTHLAAEVYYTELLFLAEENQKLIAIPEELEAAKAFFVHLGARFDQGESVDGFGSWFRELRSRIPENIWNDPELKPVFHKLWHAAYRNEPAAEAPEGYDPINASIDPEQPVQTWQVYQHGTSLLLSEKQQVHGSWQGEIKSRSGEVVLEEIKPFWQGGSPPSWADAWDEDEYGRWVEFVLESEQGEVRQRMRWMPSGSFLMGSPESDPDGFDDERLQHLVILDDGFWMFDTAVTQALWLAVMGENPSQFKGDDLPVENVNWEDCGSFIEKINRLIPGLGLSLPSEAQWEYGCRAGTDTAFNFGDAIESEKANYNESKNGQTVAVKRYSANGWGLWQMHGNVWEWTQDWWNENYGNAPIDGAAWVAGDGARRVVRGGSWFYSARYLRSAFRGHDEPGLRISYLGFRCARVQVTGQGRAEPIETGQPGAERRGAMDRSGGAASASQKYTDRTIIEGGSGRLHLHKGRDFELRSDMGRLRMAQLPKPAWASAMGRDAFGLWAEFELAAEKATVTQRMRWIPPGRFLMGSPEAEREGLMDNEKFNAWVKNEGPQHAVQISTGYWLFDTPVTQALWVAVMRHEKNPSEFKSPHRPVENVSWQDASRFIQQINEQLEGLNLSLPSEAQWEYACRAGTTTATYNGAMEVLGENNAPVLDDIAWYGGNSGVDFDLHEGRASSSWPEKQYDHNKAGTRNVALKRANAWGLYDMMGNVWEWCLDGLREYGEQAELDPKGSLEYGARRVVRGGSWNDLARDLRSAYRLHFEPGFRFNSLGFRCARVQEQAAEPIETGQPGAERKGAMDRSGGAEDA